MNSLGKFEIVDIHRQSYGEKNVLTKMVGIEKDNAQVIITIESPVPGGSYGEVSEVLINPV